MNRKPVLFLAAAFLSASLLVPASADAASRTRVTSIRVRPSSISLRVGQTRNLDISLKPSKAKLSDLTFTSSNSRVATVSSSGKITARNAGSATIRIRARLGSASGSVRVTVTRTHPTRRPTPTPTPTRRPPTRHPHRTTAAVVTPTPTRHPHRTKPVVTTQPPTPTPVCTTQPPTKTPHHGHR